MMSDTEQNEVPNTAMLPPSDSLTKEQKEIFSRISTINKDNADVVYQHVMFHGEAAGLTPGQLLDDPLLLAQKAEEASQLIRSPEYFPAWPLIIDGRKVSVEKDGQFFLSDECMNHIQQQLVQLEPDEWEDILDFLMDQCPIYICDVLTSKQTLEFAIEEYKRTGGDEDFDDSRPFTIIYRATEAQKEKNSFWSRWFGGKSAEAQDIESIPPVNLGEIAKSYEDLDNQLTNFAFHTEEKIRAVYKEDYSRIMGMLLNMPFVQREEMLHKEEHLMKKAALCYSALYDS